MSTLIFLSTLYTNYNSELPCIHTREWVGMSKDEREREVERASERLWWRGGAENNLWYVYCMTVHNAESEPITQCIIFWVNIHSNASALLLRQDLACTFVHGLLSRTLRKRVEATNCRVAVFGLFLFLLTIQYLFIGLFYWYIHTQFHNLYVVSQCLCRL